MLVLVMTDHQTCCLVVVSSDILLMLLNFMKAVILFISCYGVNTWTFCYKRIAPHKISTAGKIGH